MKQTRQLIQTLKLELRAGGLTYADVARHLQLSEASIKRLFAEHSFSLRRLEQICGLAGFGISELVEINSRRQFQLEELSLEQEQEIASDPTLLLIAVRVMDGMSMASILEHYNISETECIQKLVKLDRLKFLELLPRNRIKLLISPMFRWRKNGPIQRFFQDNVEKEFFNSRFEKDNEKLLVINGLCTPAGSKLLQQKMAELALEMAEIMKQDLSKPVADKRGNTIVIAQRQWQFSLFSKLLR